VRIDPSVQEMGRQQISANRPIEALASLRVLNNGPAAKGILSNLRPTRICTVMKHHNVLIVSCAAALISFSSFASAADIRSNRPRATAPFNPAPVKDWSGAYVGIHGGFVGTGVKSNGATPNIPALNFTNPIPNAPVVGKNSNRNTKSTNSFGGGIQAGYNFQSGNIVYGVEAEGTIGSSGGKKSAANLKAEQTARGALKGKLGYSFGSTLVYATAGVAVAPTRFSSPAIAATLTTPAIRAGKKTVNNIGPLVGLGVEHRLTEQLSVKGEVEVASFGKTKLNLPAGRTNVESSQVTAKVGLNYRF
jgi:outer membrane immunogenic protein